MPTADDQGRRLPSVTSLVVGLIAAAATASATLFGHAPPRVVILFGASVLSGALIWKVPPFEIWPKPWFRSAGFFRETAERGKSLVVALGAWGGCVGVLGALFGAFVALASGGDVGARSAWAGGWGVLIGGVAGGIYWTARRTRADIDVLVERRDAKGSG
jgi:hypothetical protein